MTFQDLWPTEEKLWLGGVEEYAQLLHSACLMAFAGVGTLDRAAVMETIGGQRWRSVSTRDAVLSEVDEDLAVLSYRAEAQRDGSAAYRCVCTSTYLRTDGRWRLVQHQQSAE